MNPTPTASLISRFTRPLSAMVLSMSVCMASAQPGTSMPRSTIEAISVSSAQRTQIEQFVSNWSPRVRSDDAQDIKRALEALTAPLQERGVSVAFRQSYTQALNQLIEDLDTSERTVDTLSLLRISGNLSTPSAVARVRAHMNHEDLGVRLFAISQAGQIFQTTSVHGPAMTGNDAITLITAIINAADNNANHNEIIRACARALGQGTNISSRDLNEARSRAIVALSDLVGDRLYNLKADEDPTFAQSLALDAASTITRSVSDITAQVNQDAARAAVRLGGDIISVALRRVVGKTIEPVDERELTVLSVQAGETLLYFARRKAAELRGQSVNNILTTQFSKMLEAGEDRDFRNDAAALLAPGSDLVREFGFDDDRFLH